MHVLGLTFTDILTQHTIAQSLHCHLNYWFTIEGGIRAPTRESGAAIATKRAETRVVAGQEWRRRAGERRRHGLHWVFPAVIDSTAFSASFSPAWPVKCAANGFRRSPLSMGGCPYHPPSRNPLFSPPHAPRIPFILISRSSGSTCHLLSSPRDKYRLIIVKFRYIAASR